LFCKLCYFLAEITVTDDSTCDDCQPTMLTPEAVHEDLYSAPKNCQTMDLSTQDPDNVLTMTSNY